MPYQEQIVDFEGGKMGRVTEVVVQSYQEQLEGRESINEDGGERNKEKRWRGGSSTRTM